MNDELKTPTPDSRLATSGEFPDIDERIAKKLREARDLHLRANEQDLVSSFLRGKVVGYEMGRAVGYEMGLAYEKYCQRFNLAAAAIFSAIIGAAAVWLIAGVVFH
jgi:hypothetical protein